MKNIDVYALLLKVSAALLLFLQPIRASLTAVVLLVIADFFSGIWASKKESKKITSSGFRRTVVKILAYMATILIAHMMELYLIPDMPIEKAVAGLIGITEGKSFFENIHRITGIDFWAILISKLNMDDSKNPKEK